MASALKKIKSSGNEYEWNPEHDDVWIMRGNFALAIHKTDEGLIVDIMDRRFLDNDKSHTVIASTYAFDAEVEGEEEFDGNTRGVA